MKRRIIAVLTFLLLSHFGYGQVHVNFIQGEIEKKDNTKIVGFVQHLVSYGNWVKYRFGTTSPIDSINSNQIKRLKTQYSEFENIAYHDQERLMHKQVSGKYNLYVYTRLDKPKMDELKPKKDSTYREGKYTVTKKQLTGTYAFITTTVYLLQANGEFTELTEGNFKQILTEKMADCASIKTAIDDKSLQLFKVGKVIKQYNSCN